MAEPIYASFREARLAHRRRDPNYRWHQVSLAAQRMQYRHHRYRGKALREKLEGDAAQIRRHVRALATIPGGLGHPSFAAFHLAALTSVEMSHHAENLLREAAMILAGRTVPAASIPPRVLTDSPREEEPDDAA